MPKRSIRVAFKALVNTGNYENLSIELEHTIHLDDDTNYEKVQDRLIGVVKRRVEQEVLEAKEDLKPAKQTKSRRSV